VLGHSEFIQWWAETEPDLLRMARSFGLRETAEDVVQDVAIIALKQRQRFSELTEFRKWARARTYWLSLDQLAAQAKKGTSLDAVISSAAVGPEQEQMATMAELWEHIQKLPPKQREVMGRSLHGQSVEEMAGGLAVASATIRSLLRFARLNLLRQMSEGEPK
jgi:RNA polymerase sigma factor (sigma-70 family)